MPYWATGTAQPASGGTSTTKFTDVGVGDHTTYESVTNPTVEADITGYYDLGSGTLTAVKSVKASLYWATSSTSVTLQYSTDNSSWTSVPITTGTGSTGWNDYTFTLKTAVTARYWRMYSGDVGLG
jgi:hypothetical protein